MRRIERAVFNVVAHVVAAALVMMLLERISLLHYLLAGGTL